MKSFVFKVNSESDVCVTVQTFNDAIQFLTGHPEFDMEEVSSISINKNNDLELETIMAEYGHNGHARFYQKGEVWNEWF